MEPIIITDELLDRLIRREFPNSIEVVKHKLGAIFSDSRLGKNRFSAAVLKLSNGDLSKIDSLIETCNYDFRDVVAMAEYPKAFDTGFLDIPEDKAKKIDDNDSIQYSVWLYK